MFHHNRFSFCIAHLPSLILPPKAASFIIFPRSHPQFQQNRRHTHASFQNRLCCRLTEVAFHPTPRIKYRGTHHDPGKRLNNRNFNGRRYTATHRTSMRPLANRRQAPARHYSRRHAYGSNSVILPLALQTTWATRSATRLLNRPGHPPTYDRGSDRQAGRHKRTRASRVLSQRQDIQPPLVAARNASDHWSHIAPRSRISDQRFASRGSTRNP